MSDDLDRRIAETVAAWVAAAREARMWLSPDRRVGISDASVLLGWNPGSLGNLIDLGKGPPVYRIGGGGTRKSVRLDDLARWLETFADDSSIAPHRAPSRGIDSGAAAPHRGASKLRIAK